MLFVSYSSIDEAAVRNLVGDLERARFEVWLDEELRGGDVWWDEILTRIRACDVILFALSSNSRQSKPCMAELHYARQLLLPVLPVQIEEMDSVRVLPISDLQIVAYTERSISNALGLVAAVQDKARSRGELPDPLPDPPAVPYAYLLRLSSAMDVPFLSVDEQAELVRQLRIGLEDEDDEGVRNDIRSLLRTLRRRNDLTVRNAADIDAALAPSLIVSAQSTGVEHPVERDMPPLLHEPVHETSVPEHEATSAVEPPLADPAPRHEPATLTPPGWYRDPSGRAAYRYWDGNSWTEQSSDGAQPTSRAAAPPPSQVPASPAVQSPTQPHAPKEGNGWSVTAIVLGVLGALVWFVGVVGIIVGIVSKTRHERQSTKALWVSIVGTVIGFTWAVLYAAANL